MADWDEIRTLLLERYEVDESPDGALAMTFGLADERSHRVFVSHAGNEPLGSWVCVEAPIGDFEEVNVPAALAAVATFLCGSLSRIEDLVTLRHTFPPAQADAEHVEHVIGLIVGSADRLERTFTGADRY